MKQQLIRCKLFFALAIILLCSNADLVFANVQSFTLEKSRAQSLYEAQNFSEAFSVYMTLLRREPDDPEVNLGLARAAKYAGKHNHASLAYQRLISAFPNEVALRVEYAYLLADMGMGVAAKEQLTEAKKLNPELEDVDLTVAIKKLDQLVSTFVAYGRVGGGVMYDSNINGAPSGGKIILDGSPFLLDPENIAKESLAAYLHASGDFGWRKNVDSHWWVIGGVSAYQRWYESDEPRRDLNFMSANLGLRYVDSKMLFELKVKGNSLHENEDSSVETLGLESNLTLSLAPQLHLILRGGYDYRHDYKYSGRDGTYFWGGSYLRTFFGENNKHNMTMGFKLYAANTQERRSDFIGFEPSVNLNLALAEKTTLHLTGAFHDEKYNGSVVPMLEEYNRKDQQVSVSAYISQKLTTNLVLEGGVRYMNNNSNSELYDYDQTQINVGLTYNF